MPKFFLRTIFATQCVLKEWRFRFIFLSRFLEYFYEFVSSLFLKWLLCVLGWSSSPSFIVVLDTSSCHFVLTTFWIMEKSRQFFMAFSSDIKSLTVALDRSSGDSVLVKPWITENTREKSDFYLTHLNIRERFHADKRFIWIRQYVKI